MVRTWRFHCWGLGLIPSQGTKILEALRRDQKKKSSKYFVFPYNFFFAPWVFHKWVVRFPTFEDFPRFRSVAFFYI